MRKAEKTANFLLKKPLFRLEGLTNKTHFVKYNYRI